MKEYKLLSTPDMKVEETINKATPQYYSNYAQSMKKAEPYENIVRNVNNQLNQLIKLCQADYKAGSLEPQYKEFLLYDSLPRLQDAVNYAIAAIEALKPDENDENQ